LSLPSLPDFYVDSEIRKAESLPASAFTDNDILELEQRTVFSHSWLLVPGPDLAETDSRPLVDFLKQKGARVPFSMFGRSFFLMRDAVGRLRCFPNVCTHAWHPLVQSAAVGGNVICPQHGRQFDSGGKFVSHAGFTGLANFPRESDNLRELSVTEWSQFLFVSMDRPVAPLDEFLGEVRKSIPRLPLDKLRLDKSGAEVREVEGNWKQHAWNYMDNFHIRFIHKGPGGLADAVDMASYRTELYRYSSLQWVYARDPENGIDPNLLDARFRDPKILGRRVFALWWFMFPNLTLNLYPWGLSVNVYMPVLGRPDRTQFLWYNYVLDEEKFQHRNETWLGDQVDAEDMEAISLVSQGAKSGYAPRGRFAPAEEQGPHWFHRLVYETVFENKDE